MTTNLNKGTIARSLPWVDRFAISISFLCLAHCLVLPLLLVLLPTLGATFIASESMHKVLVFLALPASLFALFIGCRQHQQKLILFIGVAGLIFLVLGTLVEVLHIDHDFEKIFTVIGALLIAFAHLRNFFLCRKNTDCSCH